MQKVVVTNWEPDDMETLVIKCVMSSLKAFFSEGNISEAAAPARRSMTVDEVAEYTGLCKQSVYKKTCANEIPFSKRGKRIFFDRVLIDAWLLENRRLTTSEAEKQADNFLKSQAVRRAR